MVRSIDGHGRSRIRYPVSCGFTDSPCIFTTRAATPGSGLVAHPGFVGVAPGSGEIKIEPVSVCHQVSTIGHFPLPIISEYHFHAAGLIGSPTVPSSRNELMSCFSIHSVPQAMNARTAVAGL